MYGWIFVIIVLALLFGPLAALFGKQADDSRDNVNFDPSPLTTRAKERDAEQRRKAA